MAGPSMQRYGGTSGSFGMSQLMKEGQQSMQGADETVYRNISAIERLAQILATSIGPNGLNKLIVNRLGKIFVTSDASTLLNEFDVVNHAGKLVTLASRQQSQEFGDGTNVVVAYTASLLAQAQTLLQLGLSAPAIVDGYEEAARMADALLEELSSPSTVDFARPETLLAVVRAAVATKQSGSEETLSRMVVDAASNVMEMREGKRPSFDLESVRVVKILGGSLAEGRVVHGMLLNREAEGPVKEAVDARVAVFACAIDVVRTETKGTVLLTSAAELLAFSGGEERLIERQIDEIARSGVTVVVTGGTIGDLALHYMNRAGLVVLRVQSKFDMRRLCAAIGATPLARLGAPTPEEMGRCDAVTLTEIGADRCTVFAQRSANVSRTSTIVLRGNTPNALDDLERAVMDGLSAVRSMVVDGRTVAGGGAVEVQLMRALERKAVEAAGLSQYGIRAFGVALGIVPRALAVSCGGGASVDGSWMGCADGLDAVTRISALQVAGAKDAGVVIVDGEWHLETRPELATALKNPVLDLMAVKRRALELAAQTALTVLRVDQVVMAKPAQGLEAGIRAPTQQAPRDEE